MDTTWTATFTGFALVEGWGSGGNGQTGDPTDTGGGGGGGEYARDSIPVVMGTIYFIRVGQQGSNRESVFGTGLSGTGIKANGGQNSLYFSPPAAGGTGGVGSVLFDGGPGAQSLDHHASPGGGGGSSGGPSSPGTTGLYPPGGTNGTQAGDGGDGSAQNGNAPGNPGQGPGGGGGGTGSQVLPVSPPGGVGADGAIRIWKDNGSYPPAVIVATFGSPPPPPTPTTVFRRTAFFM